MMEQQEQAESSATAMSDEEQSDDSLNLTFDEINENELIESLLQQSSSSQPAAAAAVATAASMNHQSPDDDDAVACCKKPCSAYDMDEFSPENENEYILGTLIVRIVAARDLEAVNKSGLGDLLFGSNDYANRGGTRSGGGRNKGTSNPYASVRFGNTTQRTSEVVQTVDPIWPRGESMFMDVTHAAWEQTNYSRSSSAGGGGGKAMDDDNASFKENEKQPDPGDPPVKKHPPAAAAAADTNQHKSSSNMPNKTDSISRTRVSPPPKPILTVAIFHASEIGSLHKYPTKGRSSLGGDSDDIFLGMASVDLTPVLTGKISHFDAWLVLSGSNSQRASVRVVCEYEASDSAPQPGDSVRFTDFCHPQDLYPAVAGRTYRVEEVDGDEVIISHTSAEGWVSSFAVHRFMLICVNRHHSVVDICQDELASIRERIAYSPMVHAVQETVDRVPEEGLLSVGVGTLQNAVGLLGSWWEGGVERTAQDLNFATNWDGRQNPSASTSLATGTLEDSATIDNDSNKNVPMSHQLSRVSSMLSLEALPNMPPCPITGEPMIDPVVAADGHTYERAAIARWLSESDKSPLTGSVLQHKDLVPNYMLLSSLAAAAASEKSPPSNETEAPTEDVQLDTEKTEQDEEEVTSEVSIDD